MAQQDASPVPLVPGRGRHRLPVDDSAEESGSDGTGSVPLPDQSAPAGPAAGSASDDVGGPVSAADDPGSPESESSPDQADPDGPEPAGRHSPSAAAAEPPRTSRAGRNLPAAIGVGLGLGGIVVASLLVERVSFVVIVALAVAYGTYELCTAIATIEARPPLAPLVVGGVAMLVAAWARGPSGLVVALFVTVAGVFVWRLADGVEGYLRDVSAAVLITLYLPLLAGFAVLLAHPHDGAARVIAFVAVVVCSDTGGYATGVLFGRHPLAPMVSKGKTWEGAAGSLVACVVCGSLLMTLTFHHEWWKGAIFGLATVFAATLGDLGESMIKRDLVLKDMGRLLPGHGGLMDRLDSLLPCAAIAYLAFAAFLDH